LKIYFVRIQEFPFHILLHFLIYESTPKTNIVAKDGAAAPLPSRGGARGGVKRKHIRTVEKTVAFFEDSRLHRLFTVFSIVQEEKILLFFGFSP
jgi:hypothetical protein